MSGTPMLVKLEEDKHWWFATRTRAILAVLDRYVGPGRNLDVLDVGAGAGNMIHHLSHYGKVIGLDNNPRPIEVARKRGYDVRLGSADDIPFENSSFDLVTLLDTVEHVPNEEGVFGEVHRILRPGGYLLVTVPAFMWLWSYNDVLNAHQRRYTRKELEQKLFRAGFETLFSSYNNFLVFPMAAGVIVIRKLLGEKPRLASPHFDEDAYQVEMEPTPEPLNTILDYVGRVEVSLLKLTPLPVGTSIITIARKQER